MSHEVLLNSGLLIEREPNSFGCAPINENSKFEFVQEKFQNDLAKVFLPVMSDVLKLFEVLRIVISLAVFVFILSNL